MKPSTRFVLAGGGVLTGAGGVTTSPAIPTRRLA